MVVSIPLIEPLLAGSMRVLRNHITYEELIAVYPSLIQKSLASPSTLTDSERRLVLDLPEEALEASNIASVTSLSREQLIEKAISARATLTREETVLLRDRLWTPRTPDENDATTDSLIKSGETALEELFAARDPACLPGEEEAFMIGASEFHSRNWDLETKLSLEKAELAMPYAKEWIRNIYQQNTRHWGFVCLYDAAVQKLGPTQIDNFEVHWESVLRLALEINGSKDIIDRKWYCPTFNSPKDAYAPTGSPAGHDTTYQDGAKFRKAFQDILKSPQKYQVENEELTSGQQPLPLYRDGIAGSGFLTNTFLVIDPICFNSAFGGRYDDMRILAFEADYPVKGRQYAEGYQGFTWVRLDQLVYNFYELRSMQSNQVGMDEIWKAAQNSRHGAFVSMDPAVASNWSTSGGPQGYVSQNVLMRDWERVRQRP